MLNVIAQMFKNIIRTDWIVFLGLIPTIYSLHIIKVTRDKLRHNLKVMPENPHWANDLRVDLNRSYSIFTSSITLFPLLGMFGTVVSLINVGNIDFAQAADSLDAVKGDFFTALTSTAWGIIFASVFKMINSVKQPAVEDDLATITRLVEQLKEKTEDLGAPVSEESYEE